MTTPIPPALAELIQATEARTPLGTDTPARAFIRPAESAGAALYANRNDKLDIDFAVERCSFPALQTLDPRVVRIAPGKRNEHHRHAHESLFVILEGEGEVCVGETWSPVRKGDLAFVPRWIFHQTRNTSATETLVVLAITDFGFTSAVLGDYDRRTRLAEGGDDTAPR